MHVEIYPHGACPPPHGVLSFSSDTTLIALHVVRIEREYRE